MEASVGSSSDQGTNESAIDFVEREPSMRYPFDSREHDIKRPPSSPHQSDEHLQHWGSCVADLFLDGENATIELTRWMRALLLATNAYSVRRSLMKRAIF